MEDFGLASLALSLTIHFWTIRFLPCSGGPSLYFRVKYFNKKSILTFQKEILSLQKLEPPNVLVMIPFPWFYHSSPVSNSVI